MPGLVAHHGASDRAECGHVRRQAIEPPPLSVLHHDVTNFAPVRRLSARAVATFTRLKSRSWRVLVRRRGKYVNNTFLRCKVAEELALEIERRIDRGEPSLALNSRELRRFGDLVRLRRDDLREVGKRIGRLKNVSALHFSGGRLERLRLQKLDRDQIIHFRKERAVEGTGPVTWVVRMSEPALEDRPNPRICS
jgi:hypothetical protein